ncbi:acylphosphatase [Coralloluteibacterium thermophilus]|uniref:Acylphosphatase n=1 Tax=Coralloluteibacterium thermophilum TaxID=2707049 RepID=A0ABV9NHT1_9GAMM
MIAARFFVEGYVQGVFFRASARDVAERLDIRGYARNLEDGGVEVLAIGEPEAVDALERWLWQGPEAARVDAVRREPVELDVAAGGGFHTY